MSDNHITSERKTRQVKTRFKKVFSLWAVEADDSLTQLQLPGTKFDSIADIKKEAVKIANQNFGDSYYNSITKSKLRILTQTVEDFSLVTKRQTFEIQE